LVYIHIHIQLEEEEYATQYINYYSSGLLALPEGKTLRASLAEKLSCDPTRITQKYTGGNFQGNKTCDRPKFSPHDVDKAKIEIARLERRFHLRLAVTKKKSASNKNDQPQLSQPQEKSKADEQQSTSSTSPSPRFSDSTSRSPPLESEATELHTSSGDSNDETLQLICLVKSYETNDKEQLALIRDAIELYDHTVGPKKQSLYFRDAIEVCEEAGIELDTITHYIRVNVDAFRDIKISSPYSRDSYVRKVKAAVDYDMILFRFIENSSERFPLPEEKREAITDIVIQRLSLNVDEDNNLKDIFQLSYRKPSPGEKVNVYGISRDELGSVNQHLFDTETFENQRQFAKHQVTLSFTKDQVDTIIEQASSSVESDITALQQILDDTHNSSTIPSHGSRPSFFWFKGVVYFVWIDVPPNVLRMLEERCKELYEDVMAVKIGESGEDLIKHLKKMLGLLTYLAGAKLCWVAIGIPFGLCSAHTVEQWIHFIKIELRKDGEWHSRKVLTLETIKHILERTGGEVICRGTVSGNPDGKSGKGTVITGRADGAGWIYFFRQLFTEEELKELWKMYRELSEGEGRQFIRFLLAFKVGASLDKDHTKRPRANFWAMVRGCGVFATVKGFPLVFKKEAELHKRFEESQVCCERFMLDDANGNSEVVSFLEPLRNDDQYIIEEGELQRDINKLNYNDRDTKEWLLRRFLSLKELVDMIMKGVFVLCKPTAKARPMDEFRNQALLQPSSWNQRLE